MYTKESCKIYDQTFTRFYFNIASNKTENPALIVLEEVKAKKSIFQSMLMLLRMCEHLDI